MLSTRDFPSSLLAIVLACIILLSGCQLPGNTQNNNGSYGQYYLALQQFSQEQLNTEIKIIQNKTALIPSNSAQDDYDNQIKLLLLYSLPKSPIHNSFNAKALLNKLNRLTKQQNNALAIINPSEKAFITLLNDQLNQQILMRNRLLSNQQEQQNQQQQNQQALIKKIHLLEQTIKQLKNIDQTIDKRD